MTRGSKRAMVTTLWILGVSLAAIGAFVFYNQVVMPAPVPLSGGGGALMVPPPLPPTQAAPSMGARPVPPAPTVPAPVAPVEPVVAEQPVASNGVEPTSPTEPTLVAGEEPEPPENSPGVDFPDPPENAPDLANYDALLDEANTLSRRGKRADVVAAYERAIAANPNAATALSKLAFYYLNAGQNDDAQRYALRAVTANPKSSEGWIVLGAAREALRDRDGAREAYRNCATLAEGEFVVECKRLAR